MTLAKSLTNQLHRSLDPWLSVTRKARLLDFGLKPNAILPIAHLEPDAAHRCVHPLCSHIVADARRFHQRNAPRSGLRRWMVPTAMLLDMDRFPTSDVYMRAVSKRSHGNILRASKKAARLGVSCTPIQAESYAASIAAIAASKRFRSGGPVLSAWLGGRPNLVDTLAPPSAPPCSSHWTLTWGAFIPEDGGARLIAHISLRRVGNMCRTHEIMGHGDYLKTGVVKLLFLEVARWLTDRQDARVQGLRWLMYGTMEHGGAGLHEWKRLLCFEPANLRFVQG